MQSLVLSSEFAFLAGGGEMGQLIRNHDWQQTPLGKPQLWPQSLRSMVSLVLLSKFPMMLFWGKEYTQLYNDAYRPSLGQPGKHPGALGQSGPVCWPEIWDGFAQPLFDQIAQTREAIFSEDQLVPIHRNGQVENAYWTYTYLPIIDEAGQVGGILAIVHETTQKVENVQALQQSRADLARANANLQLFVTAASHDLQDPLRKIREFGALLRVSYSAALSEQATHLLTRMETAAGRMSSLIRDLLAYSRLTTQGQSFQNQSLNTLVEHVLGDLEPLVQEKQTIVEVRPLGTVYGDSAQLELLFRNLISNALKFVKPGIVPHILITNRLINRSELPTAYSPPVQYAQFQVIEVEDNGIGFEPDQAERIFDAFYRLHTQQKYPGTGIGLSLVKRVADDHQGYIQARSQAGLGATFSVYLPIHAG